MITRPTCHLSEQADCKPDGLSHVLNDRTGTYGIVVVICEKLDELEWWGVTVMVIEQVENVPVNRFSGSRYGRYRGFT